MTLVKTKAAISKRLNNLRLRYAKQFVKSSQERTHQNCSYNYECIPGKFNYGNIPTEFERAPRKNVTLLVLQEESPIRLCMYGKSDPATWAGEICDNDDKARQCKLFKPLVSASEARIEIMSRLSDDEYVYDNYKDIATLQWVLEERSNSKLSLWSQFIFWFKTRNLRPQTRALPSGSLEELPSDLWNASSNDNP